MTEKKDAEAWKKTTNITFRVNPLTKKKWQDFAHQNKQDLSGFITLLANWACNEPNKYIQIKRKEM